MNSETNSRRSLREMEQEVEAEGRKWMRQRLQKKLQAEADGLGLVFPPEWESGQASAQRNDAPRTAFGRIQLEVWRGRNPADGAWGIPICQWWGLSAHQQLSPALEDKLAYFVTVTGAYETAVQLSLKVGIPMDDATLHALTQRLGARAQEQAQGAAVANAGGKGSRACVQRTGRADARRFSGAPSWGWLGREKNGQTPRGMA